MTLHSTTSDSDLSQAGRHGHSIASAVREFFYVWYAMLAGILLWAIHLVALASLVQLACNRPGTVWITHALTAFLLAGTVVAIVLSVRLLRIGQARAQAEATGAGSTDEPTQATGGDDDSGSTPSGRYIFMGRFGIAIGAISALLIVMEEVYAVVLHGTTCV